ncbi:hypothetical protein [Phormidium nigroviride]
MEQDLHALYNLPRSRVKLDRSCEVRSKSAASLKQSQTFIFALRCVSPIEVYQVN